MYRSFLIAAALAATLCATAQNPIVQQVFVLSEGYYDFFGGGGQLVPVTLGRFDPASGTYATVATITGPRFGSDLLVDEGIVFVAADNRVIRFDADAYQPLGETVVTGVRKLAIWGDALLITRGELGGLSHYFEARDKNTLDLLWTIDPADGLTVSAEDVIVVGNKAYLAVNNAFDWSNLAGKVGEIDLVAQTYGNEVDLGPNGLNPEKLFVKDGDVLAFCNNDFSRSSISRIGVGTAPELQYTTVVAENSGCAASALVEAEDKVYFLEYAQNELARFDLATGAVSDTLAGSPAIYGLIEDPINGVLYATTTDFFSTGDFHVLSLDGEVVSTVPATVSCGNLALDIRLSTSVAEWSASAISAYPNPATEELFVPLAGASPVEVLDAMGRIVLRDDVRAAGQRRLDIAQLPAGLYTLRAEGAGSLRFIKR
ncbi:MAG TPA: T9SS type A sorting domain-containing protein [Flavobacteriales bacterium]|nr:T9SS type A sorting domain-containing protein [Flavobacteriales bacterium]